MIEPLSCLSIATATAQFVDFGVEVVKKAREIQRTKTTTKDIGNFQQDVSQFKALCANLKDAHAGKGATIQNDGHALTGVAERCEKLSDGILTLLGKLQIQDTSDKIHSLKLAFKVQFKSGEFDRFERQLMAAKVDLCTHLLMALEAKQSTVCGLVEMLEERDRNMNTSISKRLDDVKNCLDQLEPAKEHAQDPNVVSHTVIRLESQVQHVAKTQHLLSTFRYDAMHAHEKEVKQKHAQTFQWIFSERFGFTDWLRKDDGLFWISGKAGSGKSTLMKFLFQSPDTESCLKSWAGEKKLVVSRHFFWNPGTPMQKSFQGLLRSLCYDILRACPDLLPSLCKEKWTCLTVAESIQHHFNRAETWSESEMFDLIHRMTESKLLTDGQEVCLCFFIDGLDEYQGEHDQLIKALISMTSLSNIKLCISSRPWNVFRESLSNLSETRRSLVLEDLTRGDIAAYVKDRLEQDSRYVRTLQYDPRCSELVSEITNKADGVFLWVSLVINELLKSLTNHDDFPTLLRRLRRIPPGLEPYFRYMFRNLDDFYKLEGAQIFRIMVEAPYEPPLLGLSVVFHEEPLAALLLDNMAKGLLPKEIEKLKRILDMRVAGCCGDLLEVRGPKLLFLHRTVRDFLASDEVMAYLYAQTSKTFDMDTSICRISLIGLRFCVNYDDREARPSPDDKIRRGPLLTAFYTHTRNLEDKNNRSPIDLHRTLEHITLKVKMPGPDRLSCLAITSNALELDRALQDAPVPNGFEVTRLAKIALQYLTEDNIERFYFETDVLDDPDRKGFRLATLTLLLELGADTTALWHWALRHMTIHREHCSEYRRMMFLKVMSEFKRAGALVLAEPRSKSSGRCSETQRLESIFGRSDTDWLLSLRTSLQPTSDVSMQSGNAPVAITPRRRLNALLSFFRLWQDNQYEVTRGQD